MPVICPTIDAFTTHQYRAQMEQAQLLAKRVHIDLMDGIFAPHKSPVTAQVWWPEALIADIHLMYQQPIPELEQLIKLQPNLVIIHYEAKVDHYHFALRLHENGIKAGLALLQKTRVEEAYELIPNFDHVMVYSGSLGEFGGQADLSLLDKVHELRQRYPKVEIGWDGGVNSDNTRQLVEAGVDVLNVGGFIAQAEDPAKNYAQLERLLAS
jgi:ribulose-phosphate 3-epimerase